MRPPLDGPELAETGLGHYLAWLADRGHSFGSYLDLWTWSVEDIGGFWASLWEFFDLAGSRGATVVQDLAMPGTRWFPEATTNYAEVVLGADVDPNGLAIHARSQSREPVELSFADLREQVRRARAAFESLGIEKGDRVAQSIEIGSDAVIREDSGGTRR